MRTGVDRREAWSMKHGHVTARRTHARVVAAVCLLADDAMLYCDATNAQIGRLAGLSAETVSRYLCGLERAGAVISFFPGLSGPHSRTIVLMDHSDARRAVRSMKRRGFRLNPHAFPDAGPYPLLQHPRRTKGPDT